MGITERIASWESIIAPRTDCSASRSCGGTRTSDPTGDIDEFFLRTSMKTPNRLISESYFNWAGKNKGIFFRAGFREDVFIPKLFTGYQHQALIKAPEPQP